MSTLRFFPEIIRRKFESHAELKKIIKNFGWLFSERILRMVLGIVVGIALARYLGPDGFGTLNYVIAFVTLFGVFSAHSIDRIVIRELVRFPQQDREIMGSSFKVKVYISLLSILSGGVVIYLLRSSDPDTWIMTWIMLTGVILQSYNVIDAWFQARVEAKYSSIANNIGFLISSILKFFFIMVKAPLLMFAWAFLSERIVTAIAQLGMFRYRGQKFRDVRSTVERVRSLVSEGWPLMVSSLSVIIFMRMGQIMLGEMMDDREVGIYSAALRIAEVWYFVALSVVSSVSPSIIRAREKGEDVYNRKMEKLYSMVVFLSFGVAAVVTVIANPAIRLLYGDEYADAGSLLSWLIWGGVFYFLGTVRSAWIINEGYMKFSMFSTITGAVLNVIINYLLIPRTGSLGAAISVMVSYAVSGYLSSFFYVKTRRMGMIMTRSLFMPWHVFISKKKQL